MVHAASPKVQDAYQLDTLHRFGHVRRIRGSPHWRKRRGGFLTHSDMGFYALRARLPGHVRDPPGRQSKSGHSAGRVVAAGRVLGFHRDACLLYTSFIFQPSNFLAEGRLREKELLGSSSEMKGAGQDPK